MKITDVEVRQVRRPGANPPSRWRDGLPGSDPEIRAAYLVLHTDEGVTGVARTHRGDILADLVDRRFRDELVGQDPTRREWLWKRVWEIDRIEHLPLYMTGVIDVALWDLAAKRDGVPLWRYLGAFRETIPAYASTATFADEKQYLDVADQCLELGFHGIKLHTWGDVKRDAALCVKLREHVGPDLDLMLDGSAGYDLPGSVYVGHALEEAKYLWLEEPMLEHSVTSYKELSRRIRVPLLVGEVSFGAHWNIADFIAAGCAEYVRTSPVRKGGITGALRVAHLAESFGLRAEVHGGSLLEQHLCLAIANTTALEWLVTTDPVTKPSDVDEHGMLIAPTLPGVGWEGLGELEW